MPTIRPSADLRNSYSEISDFCHRYKEPVFITKNGKGDLAVMSMEAYEDMCGKIELYHLIEQGLAEDRAGKAVTLEQTMADVRAEIGHV